MKRALFITLNEVRLYLQDKGDLAFSLLLPILTFALMFGAFGGETMFKTTANIVNEDGGVYSQELIKKLDEIGGISIDLLSEDDADAKLERSDILIALYIPSDFSDSLSSGGKAELVFKQRGNGGLDGQILASIIRSVSAEIDQEFQVLHRVENYLEGESVPADEIESTVHNLLDEERRQPVLGVTEEVVGGRTEFINQYIPGIITMYVLFAISIGAQTIVEERRRGTLERLLTTRLNAGELFFGKFIANIARGFIQTLILLALAYAVFQMFTPLSFLACLVISFIFAATASAVGMIIAAISRTAEAANWIGVVVTMFMVMMGGTFFEIPQDSVLGAFGKVSLNTYANEAYTTIIAQEGALGDVWLQLVILAAVAVIGLIISRIIFKAVPGS